MKRKEITRITWLDPLKAFALLGVMLNHLVEQLEPGSWFAPPSGIWARFLTEVPNLGSYDTPIIIFSKVFAWIGDYCPGVFIFASGFGLSWSILNLNQGNINWKGFLQRRILRLFPLYILLHVLFLLAALAKRDGTSTFADPHILLSLLGLRVTDSLFFYINPSWWFVWLIIQLYLVFPLLYISLRKLGPGKFLLLGCLFTVLSRLSGLLGFRYSESSYLWMLGIFFGTRLAEFCLGMALAAVMTGDSRGVAGLVRIGKRNILVGSTVVLMVGFASSFIQYGVLIDYLFVTMGLSGVFYCTWRAFFQKNSIISRVITTLGMESYGIYLVHQLMLQQASRFFGAGWQAIEAFLVIIVSIPVGIYLSKLTNMLLESARQLRNQADNSVLKLSIWVISVGTLAAAGLMGTRAPDTLSYRLLAMISGTGLLVLVSREIIFSDALRLLDCLISRLAVSFSVLSLFIFPQDFAKMRMVMAMLVTGLSCYVYMRSKQNLLSWGVGLLGGIAVIAGLEIFLLYSNPLEVPNHWGELPALEVNPTRMYSLKPNALTRLKYNNYDYYVTTNSLGLNSPEIDIQKPSEDTLRILTIGDAFTMPEGMAFSDAYPALLEKAVSKMISPRQVQVINAGVTAYGPAQEYPQLTELVPLLKPDIVVYEFFIDEFVSVNPNREALLVEAGLISDHEPPLYKLLESSQVNAHLSVLETSAKEALSGKPGEWRYNKALLRFYETGENRIYSPENLGLVKSYLESMKDLCQEYGTSLVIYFAPGAVEVSAPSEMSYFSWDQNLQDKSKFDLNRPYGTLLKIADELNIPTVDLRQPLKEYPSQPVYFRDSWHWNQDGQRAVAAFIAADIQRRGLLGKP